MDTEEMTNLSASLRQRLAESCEILYPQLIVTSASPDGAAKILVQFEDGNKVESVHIPEGERHTACLSTQVGCLIGCKFCATGRMGFTRNLTAGEIIGQLFVLERNLDIRSSNIVFMGMGEPLMNTKSVFKTVGILTDPAINGLSSSRITISTMGWLPGIQAMIDQQLKVKLAISLNGTSDEFRQKLMPLAGKYSVASVLEAAHEYSKNSGQRISLSYLLLAGLNDSKKDAHELAKLVSPLPAKVNLMEYNDIGGEFRRSEKDTVEKFYNILKEKGVTVTIRNSRGSEARAACGQLAVNSK